jgi:hypothetical protein
MRRILLFLVLIIGAASIGLVGGAAFLSRQNTNATARAEMLAADLQQLKIGISDYRVAQSIATNFGSVPYQNHYGTRDCKDGYFERCAYMIACDDTPLHRLLSRHPFLRRRLGFRDWGGTALIYVENGTVQEYSFFVTYRTSGRQWRGFGAEEGKTLPEYPAVQARMSDSYSVERNDVVMDDRPNDLGFQLESSLTPAATTTEQRRAWHFEFSCLSRRHGCGEICEVMPDAWQDFYSKRDHFDVEKYGSAYLFCSKRPN